jgi:hypothetical protein
MRGLFKSFLYNCIYPKLYGRKYYGWYDSNYKSVIKPAGNTAIIYWNRVIDEYALRRVYDNPMVYTDALRNMLDQLPETVKVYIQLPLYNGKDYGDGDRHRPIMYWWPLIIDAFDREDKVLGWYMLDEPEAHGYGADDKPPMSYNTASYLYKTVKKYSKKPVLCVFVDIDLCNLKYPKMDFFDIFGFDYYPFVSQYIHETDEEQEHRITNRFLNWRRFIFTHNLRKVFYVGQGIGKKVVTSTGTSHEHGFGQIKMSHVDFKFINKLIKKHFPFISGFLMWSWDYSDPVTKNKANHALIDWYKNISWL